MSKWLRFVLNPKFLIVITVLIGNNTFANDEAVIARGLKNIAKPNNIPLVIVPSRSVGMFDDTNPPVTDQVAKRKEADKAADSQGSLELSSQSAPDSKRGSP